MSKDGEYITGPEVVELLRLPSIQALYNLRHRGNFAPGVRIGKRLVFRRTDVERWYERRLADSSHTAA